jgi:group I intron endonuclease
MSYSSLYESLNVPRASDQGIYSITHISSGKIYIGSSVNLKARLRLHARQLSQNKHSNAYLQACWNRYGSDDFIINIIELFNSSDDISKMLLEREAYWINHFETYIRDKGFNLIRDPTTSGNMSHSARLNMSEKMKQSYLGVDGERKKLISIQNLKMIGADSIKRAVETRKKTMTLREKVTFSHSKEVKAKMSKAKEGMYFGSDNPFYGKKHSNHVLEKIQETNRRSLTKNLHRYIVRIYGKSYFVINPRIFIAKIFGRSEENAIWNMKYWERHGLRIIHRLPKIKCSKFKFNHCPFFEIVDNNLILSLSDPYDYKVVIHKNPNCKRFIVDFNNEKYYVMNLKSFLVEILGYTKNEIRKSTITKMGGVILWESGQFGCSKGKYYSIKYWKIS